MTLRTLVHLHRTALRPLSRRALPRGPPSLSLARFNSSTRSGPLPSQSTDTETQKQKSYDERYASQLDYVEEIKEEPEGESGSEKLKALLDEARLTLDRKDPLLSSQEGKTAPADVEFAESAGEPDKFIELESGASAEEQVKSSESARRKVFDATDEEANSEESLTTAPTGTGPLVKVPVKRQNEPEDRLLPLIMPPPVKGKMTLWFAPEEFSKYIKPLYQRGWHMGFQKVLSVNAVSHILTDRIFTFQSWKEGMEFVHGINAIAEKEFHHPHSMTMQYKGNVVQVTLTLKTHTASRCKWIEHAKEPLKAPGVTRRDLRLAVHLEQLYTYKFGGGAPSVLPPLFRQPPIPVIHKLLNLPPRKLQDYCTACGQRHPPEECTANDTSDMKRFLPLCDKCHQRHAPMAVCPKTRDKYMSPPVSPCPNCGGSHWLEDCRKPQLPPGEAKALMLPLTPEMTLEK